MIKANEKKTMTAVPKNAQQHLWTLFWTCWLWHSPSKVPYCHLISWCGNFVERHSFRIAVGNLPKLRWNYVFPQNFYTKKLGEITAFYAVIFLLVLLTYKVIWKGSLNCNIMAPFHYLSISSNLIKFCYIYWSNL